MMANRYRTKCPGPLSLSSAQRFQPYHWPMSSMRFHTESTTPSYVPTPPCPAPGTWANTFSYDDYSTKVWANDVYQLQRTYLHLQTTLLQRDILMAQSAAAYNQYPSCAYTPMASAPRTPTIPDNIAMSIMHEESYPGDLSMISRVSPDGDIVDDVLDPGNCPPETPNDVPTDDRDSVYDTSVPSANSPVFYQTPRAPSTFSPLTTPSIPPVKTEVVTPSIEPVLTPSQTGVVVKEESKSSKKSKKSIEPGRFECNVCGKVFGWRTGFVTHRRVHSGERPYMCPVCPKSFSDYSTYAKHCRIHSGEKPYSCDICGKAFTQSGNRLRHMRTVHKAKQ